MTDFDHENLAERTQDQLNGYIKFADQKASILLTAQLAFVGLYGNLIRTTWSGSGIGFKIMSGLTVAAGLVGAGSAGWAIYPRTPNTDQGLMLWKSISEMSLSTYEKKVNSLSTEKAFSELLDENHKLASVATNKYHYLRISLISTGLMLAFSVIAISVYLW
jgi:hypothetical protein